MDILSSFSHPYVVPNLYEFLYVEHKLTHILKSAGNQRVDVIENSISTMEVNEDHSLFGPSKFFIV